MSTMTKTKQFFNAKKVVLLAMISAIAYLTTVIIDIRIIPGAEFLSYEPKDVFIAIAGFLFGPIETILVSIVVSFIEMVTVSTTGPIGFVMNAIGSIAFATTASLIYRKHKTIAGAITGLVCGVFAMTGLMMLWNYLITPMYMGAPRETVAAMLVPIILPFNLVKAIINGALTMILYKPLVMALRKSKLVPDSQHYTGFTKKPIVVLICSALVLVSTILCLLVYNGII